VRLVEHSNATPPALPGQKAPQRCYEQNECPPELLGTIDRVIINDLKTATYFARLIVSAPEKYGGEEAAVVRWARATLAKAAPTVTGPLFGGRAA